MFQLVVTRHSTTRLTWSPSLSPMRAVVLSCLYRRGLAPLFEAAFATARSQGLSESFHHSILLPSLFVCLATLKLLSYETHHHTSTIRKDEGTRSLAYGVYRGAATSAAGFTPETSSFASPTCAGGRVS